MKIDLSKEEIFAICKAMSEYCRHQPDTMVASESLRSLRIKLELLQQEQPKQESIENN